jgi:hypothetical protein
MVFHDGMPGARRFFAGCAFRPAFPHICAKRQSCSSAPFRLRVRRYAMRRRVFHVKRKNGPKQEIFEIMQKNIGKMKKRWYIRLKSSARPQTQGAAAPQPQPANTEQAESKWQS